VGTHDRARLRIESSKDRSVPSTGDVFSPAAPSSVAPDPERGARSATVCLPDGACSESGARPIAQGAAEVTITNHTRFGMKFTLSDGRYLGTYVLAPAESVVGRGVAGVRITYHDGRGWSSLFLQSGRHYQFVDRGGLFVLERAW